MRTSRSLLLVSLIGIAMGAAFAFLTRPSGYPATTPAPAKAAAVVPRPEPSYAAPTVPALLPGPGFGGRVITGLVVLFLACIPVIVVGLFISDVVDRANRDDSTSSVPHPNPTAARVLSGSVLITTGTVPSVKGKQQAVAESAVLQAGLTPVLRSERNPGEKGTVFDQSPAGGRHIALGENVVLLISLGPN